MADACSAVDSSAWASVKARGYGVGKTDCWEYSAAPLSIEWAWLFVKAPRSVLSVASVSSGEGFVVVSRSRSRSSTSMLESNELVVGGI